MELDPDRRKNLIRLFMHVVDKAGEIGTTVMDFGTGEQLHQAEIHMIAAIGKNEGIHALALAETASVTRGAVSQILRRLESKDFIRREEDPENRSRQLLFLTTKGKTAKRGHDHFHKRIDALFMEQLDAFPDDQVDFLASFFEAVDLKLNEFDSG